MQQTQQQDNKVTESVLRKTEYWFNHTDYVKPFLLMCFFIFSVIFLNYYITDPAALAKSSYTHYFILLLFLFLGGLYIYIKPYVVTNMSGFLIKYSFTTAFVTCLFIILSISFYYFLTTANSNTYYWSGILVDSFTLMIIAVVGGAIFYNIFIANKGGNAGNQNLFSEILFYLPCQLNNVLGAILGDFRNTPTKTFILILVEILAIVYYFDYSAIRKIYYKLSGGQQIFPLMDSEASIFLNKPTQLTNERALLNLTDSAIENPVNFGVMFWLFINPNSESQTTSELPVFRYGDVDGQTAHPAISFIPVSSTTNDENVWRGANLEWTMGNLKFSTIANNTESQIVNIPLQKWNLVVVNYRGTFMDVFINAELVTSIKCDTPPIYGSNDIMVAGGGGLSGAMSNVQYSVLPFSRGTITSTYNNNQLLTRALPTFYNA